MKSLLYYLLVIGVGAVLWLMLATQRDTLLTDTVSEYDGVDVYMKHFTMTAMNEQGMPAFRLAADSLEHVSGSSRAELDAPDIRLVDEANQRWHITADNGTIDDGKKMLELTSSVRISRQGGPSALDIDTERLSVDIDAQRIYTDARVSLVSGPTRLRADGMMIDNLAGTLELSSAVRGEYVRE